MHAADYRVWVLGGRCTMYGPPFEEFKGQASSMNNTPPKAARKISRVCFLLA
jgi:hypothetical protein